MAEPMSPIQRLAQLSATPVPRKMVPVVKPVKVTSKTSAQDDPWGVLGSTTTPTSTSPGGQNFVGPTLDPTVIQKRAELTAQQQQALKAGVPPAAVESIVSGKGDPNRGFLGVGQWIGDVAKKVYSLDVVPGKKEFQPFVKTANLPGLGVIPGKSIKETGAITAKVAGTGLKALAGPLDTLQYGRRAVQSTLFEAGDALGQVRKAVGNKAGLGKVIGSKGFLGIPGTSQEGNVIGSPRLADWWNQTKDKEFGGGKAFENIKNPYVNQTLGFIADTFLDPTLYVEGPAKFLASATESAKIAGGTGKAAKLAEEIMLADKARITANFEMKLAQEAFDEGVRIGDQVLIKDAQEAFAAGSSKFDAATKTLQGSAAGRTYGRATNQASAEFALRQRDEAIKTLQQLDGLGIKDSDTLLDIQARGLTFNGRPAEEVAAQARSVVEAITDQTIKDIQSKGLAGLTGTVWDVLRGERTAAQEVLGVRGGLRFRNPLNPAFDIGPKAFNIPGTEQVTDLIGKAVSSSRLKFVKTPFGLSMVEKLVPTGEGGLFGSEDILRMRTSLRTGTLTPQEAEEATRLLGIDAQYRALVNNERKVSQGILRQSGLGDKTKFDPELLKKVVIERDNARFNGLVYAPATGSPEEQALKALDGIFGTYYNESVKAAGKTGYVPPFRADYYPQLQSDEAIKWARKFPKKADELAKELQVDRTWFVGNFRGRELEVDDIFFGHTITQKDLDGGVTRLNQIARDSGKINFDFFESNVNKVLNKYGQRHAQFVALQKTLGNLPEAAPTLAAIAPGGIGLKQVQGAIPEVGGIPITSALLESTDSWSKLLDPINLANANPDDVRQTLAAVKDVIQKSTRSTVYKDDLLREVDDVSKRLALIDAEVQAGTIDPAAIAALTQEQELMLRNLVSETKKLRVDLAAIPETRWSDAVDIIDTGYVQLNDLTAPDIAVQPQVEELLRNANRLKDPEFAARAQELLRDYTRFSKAWLTARPGFHVRNALNNVFQFVVAGGDMGNAKESIDILKRINIGLEKGRTPREIAERLVKQDWIKVSSPSEYRAAVDAIENAIVYSSSTGFGQIGEVAAAAGVEKVGGIGAGSKATGLTLRGGKEIPGLTPATRGFSKGTGKYLEASKNAGTKIEEYSRFALMWDGIKKGLTPQEAIARTNKYLIDYSDLSKADRVAKKIIPFWTFMSRNVPLQMEAMWTNPKAYMVYQNLRRNIEAKGENYVPSYEKDRGVFVTKEEGFGKLIPGNEIRPNFAFPGGGDDVIRGLIEEPKKFLANVNPVFRAPFEAFISGEKFFTGGKVVPAEWTDQPLNSKLKYLTRELVAPASAVGAYLRAIPGVGRQKFIEEIFGVSADQTDPLVKEVNSLLSLVGLPVGTLRREQQIREIQSRIYDLGDRIDAINKRKKKAEEERIQDYINNPPAGTESDPWGVLQP